MGLFSRADTGDALEDLLYRERDAVLAGRFDVLARLSEEKERLVQMVARDGAEPESLGRLKVRSEQNGRLLIAMRAGVAAAQKRIAAMRGQAEPLQTYDASGRKQTISGASFTAHHRS